MAKPQVAKNEPQKAPYVKPKILFPVWTDPLLIWAVARLPLLAVILAIFSDESLNVLDRLVGLHEPTIRAIYFISTLPERVLLGLMFSLVTGTSLVLSSMASSRAVQFSLPVAVCFVSVLLLVNLTPGFDSAITLKDLAFAAVICAILALNTSPTPWLYVLIHGHRSLFKLVFTLAVGVSEIVFLKPFVLWLRDRRTRLGISSNGKARLLADWMAALVIVPALAVLPLTSTNLAEFSRILHQDKAVWMFFKGDLNGLDLNRESGVLYADGHGFNHVLAFRILSLDQPPQQSRAETSRAQGLFYNPQRKELYVYNWREQAILILDGVTLELTDWIKIPALSPGDSWVVWDKFSDDIIVCSEADGRTGVPFVAVNRTSKQVIAVFQMQMGNVLLHPTQPLLYLSGFRRNSEMLAYNTQLHQIVKRVQINPRLDRMAYDRSHNELLIASPLHSTVFQYDADSLQFKGGFKAPFGVRALAIDERRNVLLCGSVATNELEVIDLKTHKVLATYYLGPWLRTIYLDEGNGVAYLTSNGGVYRVEYLSHFPAGRGENNPSRNHRPAHFEQ